MQCPECLSATKVIDSRKKLEYLYRRRQCLECGEKFSTHETVIVTRKGVKKELSVRDELDKLIKEQELDAKKYQIGYAPRLDYREGYGD